MLVCHTERFLLVERLTVSPHCECCVCLLRLLQLEIMSDSVMAPACSRHISDPDLLASCFYLHLLPLSVCAHVQDFELGCISSPAFIGKFW